jgi:hypothetical protein
MRIVFLCLYYINVVHISVCANPPASAKYGNCAQLWENAGQNASKESCAILPAIHFHVTSLGCYSFRICFHHYLYLTFQSSLGCFGWFSFRICFRHLLYLTFLSEYVSATLCTSHSCRHWAATLSESVSATHCTSYSQSTGLLLFQNPFLPLTVPHIPKALGCYSFSLWHSVYLTFTASLGLLLFQILPLSVSHSPHVTGLLLFQILPLSVPHIPPSLGILLFQILPLSVTHIPHVTLGCYSFRFCHFLYLTFPTSLGLLLFQILPLSVSHIPPSLGLHSFRFYHSLYLTFPTSLGLLLFQILPLSVSHIPHVTGMLLFQILPLCTSHSPRHWAATPSDSATLCTSHSPRHWAATLSDSATLCTSHSPRHLGCYSFRFCHSLYLTFPTSLGLLLFQILQLSVPPIPHVTGLL